MVMLIIIILWFLDIYLVLLKNTKKWLNMVYKQAGVIPFLRNSSDELQVVLITSSGRRRWIVPKGTIEKMDYSTAHAAVREAWEEAGVKGVIYPQVVGEFSYYKWGELCHVQLFLLEVTTLLSEWPERKIRDRMVVDVDEAIQRLDVAEVRELLQQLPKLLRFNYLKKVS